MDDKNKFRLLWIAIVALLVLNLSVLIWVWLQPNRPERQGEPPLVFLARKLNFTEQQFNQTDQLGKAHFERVRQVRDSVRLLKDQYFDQLSNPAITQAELTQMSEQIAHKMAEIDVLTFRHFQKVRTLLTPAQQQQFDELINEALHRQQGPQGPPPGEHGGPPPHDGVGPPPMNDGPPPRQ
ncbi:MAG: Spy/CpxP family protein refolding chaperone [Spirosomataceae bacterium]